MDVYTANSKEEYIALFPLLQQLWPALTLDSYLVRVLYLHDEGYRLLYTGIENKVDAVLGYRIATTLENGRNLIINDLITAPEHRIKGLATNLLQRVIDIANAAEIEQLHVSLPFAAAEAQRFFINQNFVLHRQHLLRTLPAPEGL